MISLGKLVGGNAGMYFMLFVSLTMNLATYYYSDKIALYFASAEPLDQKKYSFISETVAQLSAKAKIPQPKIYWSPNPQPNAFAAGRNPEHSVITVTQGLIQGLGREEIKGVLAHEIAHLKNRDILLATAASVLASTITTLSNILRWTSILGGSDDNRNPLAEIFAVLVAPLAAVIIQLAISRSREFKADKTGAQLAGSGEGLANALLKIDYLSREIPAGEVNPAFANLYIANPLGREGVFGLFSKMFSTHPPIAERVERLRKLEE